MKNKLTYLIAIFGILIIAMTSCRYVTDAQDTAFDEFKPSELLRKYEYFKDVSASLDAKFASIGVYESRFKDLIEQYEGIPRRDWSRGDKDQYNMWQNEQAGIKASYNILASEYNSAMSKFNYAFCNVGTLPKGATVALPREYRAYITK